jgi:hypothetical protein
MKPLHCFFKPAAFALNAGLVAVAASPAMAQIVINEIVKEERTAGGGALDPDTREFIELYNAGTETIDLTGWSLGVVDLLSGSTSTVDVIPSGTIAPGGYFVIGGAGVPQADYVPVPSNLYPDLTANLIELRDPAASLVDAIGYDIYRVFTATGPRFGNLSAEQIAQIDKGFRGPLFSPNNTVVNNSLLSWGRYRDGVDTNANGLDFGILPVTPGASNTLPQAAAHTIPDVDSLAPGTDLSDAYYGSFTLPRVVDPTVVSTVNPRAIPASPQGGNAIAAWDNSGGGNAVYSRELVNSFDLYAYLDTTPLGVASTTNGEEWETTAYGIGSTDPLYQHPDPTGGIFVPTFNPQNGSTGVGWVYQQYENAANPSADFSRLALVDFGSGGNSSGSNPDFEWTVIETIDVTGMDADWYRLGIDYDPTTGDVVATFDDQVFEFNTTPDVAGTFFVGYREAITGAVSLRLDKHNPPIYDLYEEVASVVGDYNSNGTVGPEDYTVWANTYGSSVTAGSGADGNGDGVVNAADYTVWRDADAASLATAVPEPTAMAAIAIAGLLGATGWRRR